MPALRAAHPPHVNHSLDVPALDLVLVHRTGDMQVAIVAAYVVHHL